MRSKHYYGGRVVYFDTDSVVYDTEHATFRYDIHSDYPFRLVAGKVTDMSTKKTKQADSETADLPIQTADVEIMLPASEDPDNLTAIELAHMFGESEVQGWLDVSAPERVVLENAMDALRGTFLGFFEFPHVFANVNPTTGEVETRNVNLRVGRFADATLIKHDRLGMPGATQYQIVDCYITASLLRSSFDRIPIGARIIMRRTARTRKIGMGNAVVYDVLASPEIVQSALSASIGKNPIEAPKALPAPTV